MAAKVGSYKQAHNSPLPLTMGNSRVEESPASVKELISRAQTMRGVEPDSKDPDGKVYSKDVCVARISVTGAPPWSQAWGWGWGSQASAWWPGPSPRDPVGQNPNGRRGPAFL